jgi:hypothetical protein
VLTAAIAIVFGLWALRAGVRQGVDTATYSQWADLLIKDGFNFSTYLRDQNFVAPPLMYLAWVTLLAIVKSIFGSAWMPAIVVLNWLALVAGVYATLRTIRETTRSTAGLLLATLLFTAAGDLLIFVPYVLSDLIFWGLSTVVLAMSVTLVVADDVEPRPSAMRTIIAGTVVAAIAFIFRPVAIPLVIIWVMAIAAYSAASLFDRLALPILGIAAVTIAAILVWHASLMQNPASWPFGSQPGMLRMISTEYHAGIVVHQGQPPVVVAAPTTFGAFMLMTADKLMYFITPWLPHYSGAHQAINFLFFAPAYALSIVAIRNIRRLTAPQRRAATLLTLYAIGLSAFHAMALIDSDHRYRLPLLPALIMLAAVGLESARRPRMLPSTGRTK